MGDLAVRVAAVVTTGLGVAVGDDWLFRDLDVDLPSGRTLALTGRNGTGKSTLLHCLYGLRPPTEGTVTVLGGTPDERSAGFRGSVAVVLDDSALFDELTPRQHLDLLLRSFADNAAVAPAGVLLPVGVLVQLAHGPDLLVVGLLIAGSGLLLAALVPVALGFAAYGVAR